MKDKLSFFLHHAPGRYIHGNSLCQWSKEVTVSRSVVVRCLSLECARIISLGEVRRINCFSCQGTQGHWQFIFLSNTFSWALTRCQRFITCFKMSVIHFPEQCALSSVIWSVFQFFICISVSLLDQWFSIRGSFAPTGGHLPCLETFLLPQLGRCYWYLVGREQGCC